MAPPENLLATSAEPELLACWLDIHRATIVAKRVPGSMVSSYSERWLVPNAKARSSIALHRPSSSPGSA